MTVKNSVFWYVRMCSPADVYEHLGGMYCSRLQDLILLPNISIQNISKHVPVYTESHPEIQYSTQQSLQQYDFKCITLCIFCP
jgi:hypothetical protein